VIRRIAGPANNGMHVTALGPAGDAERRAACFCTESDALQKRHTEERILRIAALCERDIARLRSRCFDCDWLSHHAACLRR